MHSSRLQEPTSSMLRMRAIPDPRVPIISVIDTQYKDPDQALLPSEFVETEAPTTKVEVQTINELDAIIPNSIDNKSDCFKPSNPLYKSISL